MCCMYLYKYRLFVDNRTIVLTKSLRCHEPLLLTGSVKHRPKFIVLELTTLELNVLNTKIHSIPNLLFEEIVELHVISI